MGVYGSPLIVTECVSMCFTLVTSQVQQRGAHPALESFDRSPDPINSCHACGLGRGEFCQTHGTARTRPRGPRAAPTAIFVTSLLIVERCSQQISLRHGSSTIFNDTEFFQIIQRLFGTVWITFLKLGLPGLFLHDGLDGEISIGGGQLMSCPQLARIGQLLVS